MSLSPKKPLAAKSQSTKSKAAKTPKAPDPEKERAKAEAKAAKEAAKELERKAGLCKCRAGCQIPAVTADEVIHHGSTKNWCDCKDYEYRGGSYRDPDNNEKICKHAHYQRVLGFVAPPDTPLGQFQIKNPLGLIENTEALITKLCGPPPTKTTNASNAAEAARAAFLRRHDASKGIEPITPAAQALPADVEAILNKPLPPRRRLKILGQ